MQGRSARKPAVLRLRVGLDGVCVCMLGSNPPTQDASICQYDREGTFAAVISRWDQVKVTQILFCA